MRVQVKVAQALAASPAQAGERELTLAEGASVAELLAQLAPDLSGEDMLVIIDNQSVPPSLRAEQILLAGQRVTLMPLIKGG